MLGYSNGCVMYLPRAQDYPPGGWDVHVRYKIPDMLFQNYLVPVAFHPDSEQRVVATAPERLLNELASDPHSALLLRGAETALVHPCDG